MKNFRKRLLENVVTEHTFSVFCENVKIGVANGSTGEKAKMVFLKENSKYFGHNIKVRLLEASLDDDIKSNKDRQAEIDSATDEKIAKIEEKIAKMKTSLKKKQINAGEKKRKLADMEDGDAKTKLDEQIGVLDKEIDLDEAKIELEEEILKLKSEIWTEEDAEVKAKYQKKLDVLNAKKEKIAQRKEKLAAIKEKIKEKYETVSDAVGKGVDTFLGN